MKQRLGLVLLFLYASTAAAGGIQVNVYFSAVQKYLNTKIYNEQGRKYLLGGPESKCNYAYLEDPRISSVNNKIRLTTRFSGMIGTHIKGECLGIREQCEVKMVGKPYFKDGILGLEDVMLEDMDLSTQFGVMLDAFFRQEMPKFLQIHLLETIQSGMTDNGLTFPYQVGVPEAEIEKIKIDSDRIVLDTSFSVVLK